MGSSVDVPEKDDITKVGSSGAYYDTLPTLLDQLRDKYGQDNLLSKIIEHLPQCRTPTSFDTFYSIFLEFIRRLSVHLSYHVTTAPTT